MKKYIFLFINVVTMSVFVGCDYDDLIEEPAYAVFDTTARDFTVTENSSGSFDVTVYTADVSGSDRTFSLDVAESSTLNAGAYTLPSSVTVPGGSNESTFTVEITDTNIDNAGETLVLNLVDASGATYVGAPLTVNVLRFCPIDLNDYVGSFTGTGSWSEHYDYTTEVETFLNEDGELMINGLAFQWFQDWWGEVIVRNEPVRMQVNPETGAITIPEQFYIESTWEGEVQPEYSIKGTGFINSCEGTMTIRPVLVQGGADIDGTTWGSAFQEVIRLADDSETDGGEETEGEETEEEETEGEA